MEIEIQNSDIFDVEVEAMVYPGITNGELTDTDGKRLIRLAGRGLEEETRDTAPIAVGAATVVEVEGLKAEQVIYSPLVTDPSEKIIVENVRRCTRAALVAACYKELESIALPVIHPNSEDMSITETARAMIDELRGFRSDHDFTVYLVDQSSEIVEALHRAIENVR